MARKLSMLLVNKVKIVGLLCACLIGSHIANVILNGALFQYGIQPRELDRLHHIFTAPWVHGSFSHLLNNLVGIVVFSWLCLIRSVRLFWFSSFIIVLVTGLLVWLFGRPANHIGASGWVFGLWSLSISLAWFDRRLINIVIAMLVILFYGGMVFGMLPQSSDVSFESHLFGAVAGAFAAWLSTLKPLRKKLKD